MRGGPEVIYISSDEEEETEETEEETEEFVQQYVAASEARGRVYQNPNQR